MVYLKGCKGFKCHKCFEEVLLLQPFKLLQPFTMSMSEDKLKKIIALVGAMVCAFSYIGGYVSGVYGWWWTFILVPAVFFMILNSLSGGGGGGHH